MKPIHALAFLLLLVACFPRGGTAAEHYSVLVQGGISSYNGAGGFSPGMGDDRWKMGPLLNLGLRWTTSQRFSLAATVEYCTYAVKNPLDNRWVGPGNPTNTIFDVNLVARWQFWRLERLYASLPIGLGYWHQNVDPVESDAPYPWSRSGFTASGVGGVLGLGLGAELTRELELYLEGTYRIRTYTTPAAQLGLAYRLD